MGQAGISNSYHLQVPENTFRGNTSLRHNQRKTMRFGQPIDEPRRSEYGVRPRELFREGHPRIIGPCGRKFTRPCALVQIPYECSGFASGNHSVGVGVLCPSDSWRTPASSADARPMSDCHHNLSTFNSTLLRSGSS